MALVYADASALLKLVRREERSDALLRYLDGTDVVSSSLVLAEVPRAIRRICADEPRWPRDALLEQAARVVEAVALIPVDDALLVGAGALDEPHLRALDAIHVATAVSATGADAFITYDQRQAAAARLAGLRTVAPGAA